MLLGLPLGVLRVKVRYNEHKHAAARAQCTYKTRTQRACYALRQPTSPACTQPRMRAPGLARTRTYTTNTAPLSLASRPHTHAKRTNAHTYQRTNTHTHRLKKRISHLCTRMRVHTHATRTSSTSAFVVAFATSVASSVSTRKLTTSHKSKLTQNAHLTPQAYTSRTHPNAYAFTHNAHTDDHRVHMHVCHARCFQCL